MSTGLDLLHPGGPTRDALFDFLQGRLQPDAAAWIRAHVETCPECTRVLDRLSAARELLEPPDAPFLGQRSVAAALRRADPQSAPRLRWRVAVTLGVLCVAGISAAVAWRATRVPPPGSAPVAAAPRVPFSVWTRAGAAQLGDESGTELEAGAPLQPGDSVTAKAGSRLFAKWGEARVLLEGEREGAGIRLDASEARERRVQLAAGRVTLDVDPLAAGASLAVVTERVRVTVHGTRFFVEKGGVDTLVAVDHGRVLVEVDGHSVELTSGTRWSLSSGRVTSLEPEDRRSLDDFPALRGEDEGEPGSLEVLANVPDADVEIDGQRWGRTPVSALVLPGRHTVKVGAQGRMPVQEWVNIVSGKPSVFNAELTDLIEEAPAPTRRSDPLSKARALVVAKAYPSALAQLQAIRRNRGSSATLVARATLLEAQVHRLRERPEQALPLLKTVAEGSGPEAQQAQMVLAQTLGTDLNDPRGAAEAWSMSRKRFPRGIFAEEATFREGEARLAAGDGSGGVAALERYLSDFPRGARAVHAHLMAAGARRDFLGDCAGALTHFDAIARDRSSASQLALIGEARCLRTLGREDQARSVYAQYLTVAPHGRYAAEARAQTQTVSRRK